MSAQVVVDRVAPHGRERPPKLLALLLATRPRTLPVGAAPVVLGTAAAAGAGSLRPGLALAALGGALLIQVGTNYANDLFDAASGADGPDRLGPARAVASGWLTPAEVTLAAGTAFSLAVLCGVSLVAAGGWPIAAIGIAGIISGMAYTGGPIPLGYRGLGDVFAFAFFGPVAVGGTYFVQAGPPPARVLAAGAALGLLAAAVLAVNNIRDIEGDARAGKRTLAVRLGRPAARAGFAILLAAAFAIAAILAERPLGLLPLAMLPLAGALAGTVARRDDGPSLNAALAGTACLLSVFTALWVPSWLWP